MKTETVFLGRDNSVDLLLKADGTAADLSSVTKITASFRSVLISSEDSTAGAIRWEGDDFDTGEIQLHLGDEAIPAGKYSVPIVVYDAANANGIQWTVSSTDFGVPILVKADQEAGA